MVPDGEAKSPTEEAQHSSSLPKSDLPLPDRIGPILFLRDSPRAEMQLSALVGRPHGETPRLVANNQNPTPRQLYQRQGVTIFRFDFTLSTDTGGEYAVDEARFVVKGVPSEDLQFAYLSCNGQEEGDRDRPLSERNAMWTRLAEHHAKAPFSLLLQGGDQIYSDEMLQTHPLLQAWEAGKEEGLRNDVPIGEIEETLRDFLFHWYLHLYAQESPAWVLARIPSLCMWDDHDICDGWGSLPEKKLDCSIGEAVLRIAREFFLLFQMATHDEELPPICRDRQGKSLTWSISTKGVDIIAPDLRSERRPKQVMGESGWRSFQQAIEESQSDRVILMSSVPALGPRLSWVEALMKWLPGIQKYEDDLRDQWQSRSHREEWKRFLRTLLTVHEQPNRRLTVLSGEIHLATRATMSTMTSPLHQLIASGIAHPPPTPWYGRALGLLAQFGEAPLRTHPIELHSLPGRHQTYTSQRNFLMLRRRQGKWSANWELEHDGTTKKLEL